jgi:hypothetical protein
MSLARVVVAGAVGGALSIVTSRLVTGVLFHRFQAFTPATWRREGPGQYLASSVLAVAAGAVVGLLFVATGGADGLGLTSWLARGLMFGFLLWLAVAVPSLVGTALYVNLHRGVVVGLLLDSLVGLALVSGACAWASW